MDNMKNAADKKLYPFHIVFKRADGKYDWQFQPARTRQDAINDFIISSVNTEVSGVHLCKRPDCEVEYEDPDTYKDEFGIEPERHESIEKLEKWCRKLEWADRRINIMFGNAIKREN